MNYIDIVFDGPPDHNAPHFVEVEDSTGKSIRLGDWIKRDDGYWALRIPHEAAGNEPAAQPPMWKPYHDKITLTWGGKPTPFKVGDRVKTRGDIGEIRGLTVFKVHNEWFCECSDWNGNPRHFNMAFLEPDESEDTSERRLSDSALTKLGQAMLADYVAHSSMTTTQRLTTALRELATATQDTLHAHYAETRCCLVTRQKCEAAKELLAEFSKATGLE